MWRSAVTRSLILLPSRSANRNPSLTPVSCFARHSIAPFLASSYFSDSSVGLESCLPQFSRLHSAAGPWKPEFGKLSIRRRVPIGSAAATADPAAEAEVVLGSWGYAPALLFQKVRGISEVVNHYGRCYWELSKARLSMLVVATSGAGYVLGSGHVIDVVGLCCTCAGTMMVAASANTLNQVFEVQNDAKMKRTRQRPLPSCRIGVAHAVMWASSMGFSGTTLLAWKANYLAAGLAVSNLFLYAFVYTPLKQIHPANTWVGAVVGAIPPLLGWAAASGEVSLNAMLLPAALYFWQIPHFMALAYLCRGDYIAGGFKMFSFSDVSGWRTATACVSLRNCLYLLPLGFLAYDWGITSKWFAVESSFMTLLIGTAALLFLRERTTNTARRMFYASLLYLPLFVFMSGLLFHRVPKTEVESLLVGSSPTEELLINENEEFEDENRNIQPAHFRTARPLIAYASAAPFPFLPAPTYAYSSL
ncbi:LOW QUALITY PROTEIN: protoheme IX farnesyltransferase, mitochondrial-like [Phalaenopsis equestris]|uniref:LOW QUALITY PROTEIN: protoheme IX farnesyltransferase, mitochondrial-like n=1 Tax=Phalaenopsis equestris TaxID=78828 RepID=UPI0009E535AB|nr:LOW QUALITY PROTEIN: protoheme IX farnesyltransferase, mitochondrial-like [Phalaenopsis equestris]